MSLSGTGSFLKTASVKTGAVFHLRVLQNHGQQNHFINLAGIHIPSQKNDFVINDFVSIPCLNPRHGTF
jgi:hypothetical protein